MFACVLGVCVEDWISAFGQIARVLLFFFSRFFSVVVHVRSVLFIVCLYVSVELYLLLCVCVSSSGMVLKP